MKVKPKYRTPISYYGGKQVMAKHILPLIPQHKVYTEAFFGGGAIFFAKEPSEVEVINDVNGEVINFYRVVSTDFWRLNELIQGSLHSRKDYENALVIYNYPDLFDPIKRAWAFWVLTNQGFVSKIGAWGYDRSGNTMVKKVSSKKVAFNRDILTRLERTQIECNDAVKVIESRDGEDTFHYVDPPYLGTQMGHYFGYTEDQYVNLLNALSCLKGKFMLSGFHCDILSRFLKKNRWSISEYDKQLAASTNKAKRKTEVIVTNFLQKSCPKN